MSRAGYNSIIPYAARGPTTDGRIPYGKYMHQYISLYHYTAGLVNHKMEEKHKNLIFGGLWAVVVN
ncbi:MAG: hypothetical protein NC400_10520 [Clostridium sp.]|nr:hypothetical protein [Clostridium sp.]